jgi:hypothetical protein
VFGVTNLLPKNSLQSTTEAPKSVNVLQEVEAIEGDVDLQQRLILSPLSYFKIRWDVLVMLCVIVVSIQIPFQIGFNIESEGFLSLFDIVVNAIFILDMLLLFRCAYFDSNTELFITTPWRICVNYMRSTFCIDLISSIPIDIILQYFFYANDASAQARSIKLVRISRLVRLTRLLRLLRGSRLLTSFSSWLSLRPSITAFISLVAQIFFVAHWFACMFAFVSSEDSRETKRWWLPTLRRNGFTVSSTDEFSLGARYLAAMYFSITTATTTGFGDITPTGDVERIYLVFGMILTALFFGYSLGSISSVYEMINASHYRREARTTGFNQYIIDRRLPFSLARRMRHFFNRYVLRRSAYNEELFMSELTDSLRREVTLFLHRDVIDSVPFFRNFIKQHSEDAISKNSFISPISECVDLNLLYQIMISLTPIFALPGEFLAREGEAPREIIFLVSGRVSLTKATQKEPAAPAADGRPPLIPTDSLRRRASMVMQRINSVFERPRAAIHNLSAEPPLLPEPPQLEIGTVEPGGMFGDAEVRCFTVS